MSMGGEISYNLRVDTALAQTDIDSLMSSFRKLELVALRYLTLARRMNLPDDVERALDLLARTIVIIRQVQMAYNLLYVGMGPVGWAMFVAGGLLTAASVADMAGSYI